MARDMNRCAVKNSCTVTLANSSTVVLANSLELSYLEIQDISFMGSLSKEVVTGCSDRCRPMRSSCHAEGQNKRATLCLCVWSKKVCQYLNTYLHASSAETSETRA